VTIPRAPVDVRRPPADLDALVEWLDGVGQNLVLLEPYPLDDLRRAVAAVDRTVRAHCAAPPPRSSDPRRATELEADHRRYAGALEELRGLLRVVELDDHGGHRQALGQYGRVLAESLRLHRALETAGGRGPASGRSRNSN